MHSYSLRTANFLLVLLVLVFSCVFANPEDYIEVRFHTSIRNRLKIIPLVQVSSIGIIF